MSYDSLSAFSVQWAGNKVFHLGNINHVATQREVSGEGLQNDLLVRNVCRELALFAHCKTRIFATISQFISTLHHRYKLEKFINEITVIQNTTKSFSINIYLSLSIIVMCCHILYFFYQFCFL